MSLDKADEALLNDKNTIVIIPEIGEEYKIARRWLTANASKVLSEQRVFTELVISALQTDISIVTVARNFENATKTEVVDNDGRLHYPSRPESDLLSEVVLSKPVKVAKYWIRDNPMRPGRPDVPGMLEALGVASSPWRFDFIDKGETKPEILKLFKV